MDASDHVVHARGAINGTLSVRLADSWVLAAMTLDASGPGLRMT